MLSLEAGTYYSVGSAESRREKDRIILDMRARASEESSRVDREREKAYWTIMNLRRYRSIRDEGSGEFTSF